MRTANYSDFLSSTASLVGVDQSTLQSTELTFLNTYFNKAIRKVWEASNWTDICPNGEARFPQNLITYPNDFSQTGTWTSVGATVTPNALANPLDARTNASLIQEDTSTGSHGVGCTFGNIPSSSFQVSGYARPYTATGDNYIIVELGNGTDLGLLAFNLTNCTCTTTFSSGAGVFSPSISQQQLGYSKWSIQFNASASSSIGNIGLLQIVMSNSSSSVTTVGNTNRGIYAYGTTISNPASMVPAVNIVPWEQPGEAKIDVSFATQSGNPGAYLPPSESGTLLTPNGIQILGPTSCGPVYLHYRYRRPNYMGNTLNLASGYASSTTVYYTTSTGSGNFYCTTTTTTPAQTPESNPSSFQILEIPYVFFEYCVYSAYGDWLEVEGQSGKAQSMREFAQSFIDDEHDRQERQQGNVMPWRVYTHVTSQNRGLGYLGSNYNPVGALLSPNS